jgi:hypothetical protein
LKKEAKNFCSLGALARAAVNTNVTDVGAYGGANAPVEDKSFLLLFFKKEALPYFFFSQLPVFKIPILPPSPTSAFLLQVTSMSVTRHNFQPKLARMKGTL